METTPPQGSGRRVDAAVPPERGRALPYGLMGVALILITIGFWPGHMSSDTLFMIEQAAGAIPINDHHSPVLLWLWSLGWPVGLRPGVILVLQLAAFFAGSYLVARAAFGRLGAALVAIAVAFAPSVFGDLGVLARDVWYIGFLLLSFGLIILAIRRPQTIKPALIGAFVFALLSLAARQNAATAVVVVAIAGVVLVLWPRLEARRRIARLAIVTAAGIGLTVLAAASLFGVTRLAGTERWHPEQYVYLYDLAGLSVRTGESQFPESIYPSDDVAPIAATSSLDSLIPLGFGEQAPIPMPQPTFERVDELRDAWIDTVTEHPKTYLDWRADAWLHQIGIGAPGIFVYHPVIDPNERGYEVAFEFPNEVARNYQELFTDSAINGHVFHLAWVYLLLAIGAMVVLFRTRGAPLVVGGLALTGWTYQVGLFFGTMGTSWRFEFPVAATTLLAVAVAIKVVVDRRRAGGESRPAEEPQAEGPHATDARTPAPVS